MTDELADKIKAILDEVDDFEFELGMSRSALFPEDVYALSGARARALRQIDRLLR